MAKKEETFLLVSLEEDKAKKLAQVVSNDTCRKILDYLSRKEATETQLSKELNMPISTVHYNIKQLLDNGLIKAEEFHYSEKGKEVNHYRLANKFIIIAPAGIESLPSKLKKFLPAALLIAAASVFIHLFSNVATYGYYASVQKEKVSEIAGVAKAEIVQIAPVQIISPNIALWFLIGGLSALTVYFVFDLLRERFKK